MLSSYYMPDDFLPKIGKWMLNPDGEIADWLGYKLNGKTLQEPINIIFVDKKSQSEEQSKTQLLSSLKKAGYPLRTGHSSGYHARINNQLQPQFPNKYWHAFSDNWYFFNNNHGRIFGPLHYKNYFIFTAAFSKELVSPFTKIKHIYGSFNQARDDLAQRLNSKTKYKIHDFYDLKNSIENNPKFTTGDHDSIAIILSLT